METPAFRLGIFEPYTGTFSKSFTKSGTPQTNQAAMNITAMLKDAFRDRSCRLILIGFGTCSFNMSIIESHLFSHFLSFGIEGSIAAAASYRIKETELSR